MWVGCFNDWVLAVGVLLDATRKAPCLARQWMIGGVIVQVAARYGSKPILSFTAPRSRVIFLADYNVEKRLVLAVPHRMLLGEPEELPWNLRRKQPPRRRGGDDRGTARSEAVKGQSTITRRPQWRSAGRFTPAQSTSPTRIGANNRG